MANVSASRLKGDDYQHLFSWGRALELLRPLRDAQLVAVEDPHAWSVDDVTVRRTLRSQLPDQFFQVKYHVDQRDAYSTDRLLAATRGTSLLRKLWVSYRGLLQNGLRLVELHLVSNWAWDIQDPIASCIDGENAGLTERFFAADQDTAVGRVRKSMREHLSAPSAEFDAFARSLRLRVGHGSADDLRQQVADQMEHQGLASDENALLVAVGIVRDWIKRSMGSLNADALREIIGKYKLWLPSQPEQSSLVVMNTITSPFLDVAPDHELDWTPLFVGPAGKKGHQLLDPQGWNARLLPQLQELELRVKTRTPARLIRARGASRLAPWIALGFTFAEVGGYVLEVQQRTALWRTDTPPAEGFELVELEPPEESARFQGPRDSVAVVLDVTDRIESDVATYLGANPMAGSMRVFAPGPGASASALGSAGDAVALAQGAKRLIRAAAREAHAQRVLLFYCGPASGACFLGHSLNAAVPELVVMEHQQPGYAPTFTLR